ncbi:putative F-box protein [Drosera capensis]
MPAKARLGKSIDLPLFEGIHSSISMKTPKYSYHHRQHHHQANFLQLKLSNDDELPDRISELPDEVLCCILSHLSLQEAARTTILSCRWRYVWKWMMSWTLTLQKSAVD